MSTTYDNRQELSTAILAGARAKSNNDNPLVQNGYAAGLMAGALAEIFLAYPEVANKVLPVFNLKSLH